MSMLENARLMKKIAKHGLDFVTETCEKTLISTTTTMCNGEEIYAQEIDMQPIYEIFERRLIHKLKKLRMLK
jgi:hypothetical protein